MIQRYCPYPLFSRGWAIFSTCSLVINPFCYAISSIQAILMPCRCSITCTNCVACISESKVPVSSQAVPRSRIDTFSFPRFRYSLLTSVISYSPLALGFRIFGDRNHFVIIKIQTGNGIIAFRFRGFFFDRDRIVSGHRTRLLHIVPDH